MKLQLKTICREAQDTLSFLFEPERPFRWEAGQYLRYKLPHAKVDDRGDERYFTIASAPHEQLVMLTARFALNGSSFKRALCRLNRGDIIEADELGGDFTVTNPERQYLFIAGGIGITPFRSILLDLNYRRVAINATLLYANRTDEFPFRVELEGLRARHSKFEIAYFIHPHQLDQSSLESAYAKLDKPLIYVSGPEPMVESFAEILKRMGVAESDIKNDYFPGYEWVAQNSGAEIAATTLQQGNQGSVSSSEEINPD